jgi:hypothetical protein
MGTTKFKSFRSSQFLMNYGNFQLKLCDPYLAKGTIVEAGFFSVYATHLAP